MKIRILSLGIMTPFCIVKYKVVRVNAMKAFGEGDLAPFILNSSNVWTI